MKANHHHSAGGKLRNDIWVSDFPVGVQAAWKSSEKFDERDYNVNSDIIQSQMKWYESNAGKSPPATWPSGPNRGNPMTYDDWITCQEFFRDTLPDPNICDSPKQSCYDDITSQGCRAEAVWKKDNMWSPRRGHGAIVAGGKLYVIGGKAREYTRIDDRRLVGGVSGNKIETISNYPTIREEAILKNDIWISDDGLGENWRLLTPGCKDPQQDVLIQTEVWSRDRDDPSNPKYVGSFGSQCTKTTDCYGQATCQAMEGSSKKVCVCPMFSVREHHSVSVQHSYYKDEKGLTFSEDYIYVVGGFTTVRQSFCSNRSCGSMNSYRLAMDDAWVSNDGATWVQFKAAFSSRNSFRGRGAHASLLIHAKYFDDNVNKRDKLWIFGGETSSPEKSKIEYLDDVWNVNLPKEPCCFKNNNCNSISHPLSVSDIGTCLPSSFDWYEIKSSSKWSGRSGHVVLFEHASSLNSFREQIYLYGGTNEFGALSDVWTWDINEDKQWRKDFSYEQWYRNIDNGELYFGPGLHSGANLSEHIHPYSYYFSENDNITALQNLYLPLPDDQLTIEEYTSLKNVPLISAKDIDTMKNVGVYTIRDLADVDLYTLLKMRGFDHPWEEKRIVKNICYIRALATEFIKKCQVQLPTKDFNIATTDMDDVLCKDGACNLDEWDGCTPLDGFETVDIHGLGFVTVPQEKQIIINNLEEINCRQIPGKRQMAVAVAIENKMIVMGGKGENPSNLYQDVWYRDDTFPAAKMVLRPESYTHDSLFLFQSDEAGAQLFEYKIFDVQKNKTITPWIVTTVDLGADVSWLDDRRGGPGKGLYGLYARAIDPGGNRDIRFSTKTNVHYWMYIPPPNWGAIFGVSILIFVILISLYLEYRRRSKKKALERYALRRMRRKYKLQQKIKEGNGDWKESYLKEDKYSKQKEKQRSRKSRVKVRDMLPIICEKKLMNDVFNFFYFF